MDSLDPLRIAAISNMILDVVIDGPAGEAEAREAQDASSGVAPQEPMPETEIQITSPVAASQKAPSGAVSQRYTYEGIPENAFDSGYGVSDYALYRNRISEDTFSGSTGSVFETPRLRYHRPNGYLYSVLAIPSPRIRLVASSIRTESGVLKDLGDLGALFLEFSSFDGSQSDSRAVKATRQMAQRGDMIAQYRLGSMYLSGEGVKRNFTKAAEWFLEAAEQGHTDA
ncbi:hypothetical protein BGX29_008010 [Mortierella sp. GBA35]|nr:hypothetical protein BGX29_008010 [Mortierella sp. GBA35]